MSRATGTAAAPLVAQYTINANGQLILMASKHRVTGKIYFPVLPESLPIAQDCDTVTLSPEASLYSFTIVHPNPKTGQPPYTLAFADFPEEVRVLGRFRHDDGTRPAIGARLRVTADVTAAGEPTYVFVSA